MLRDSHAAANPIVERFVKQLTAEECRHNSRERRSAHREPFFRPTIITMRDDKDFVVRAFTRNISSMGVGIVSDLKFTEGRMAYLKIHSLEQKPMKFLAECRWSHNFGEGWFTSGWNFLNIVKD